MALCPNRHDNSSTLAVCSTCGLPLVDFEREFSTLVSNLASRSILARPKPRSFVVGIGSLGAQVSSAIGPGAALSVPDLTCLTLDTSEADTSRAHGAAAPFSLRIGNGSSGSSVFCGRCETMAEQDPSLVPLIINAGLRESDENQAVLLVLSMGEGTASGVAPVFLRHAYSLNPECSTFVLAIVPASSDSLHAHINAYYGVSRLLGCGGSRQVDGLIVLQADRLKKLRGVGQGGEELKMNGLVEGMFGLLASSFRPPNASKFAGLNRWMRSHMMVPCLSLGRSLEIFGSLQNVLESSIAYPLCPISREEVIVSELLLRIPRRLETLFPEQVLAEEIASFNRLHFPNMKSGLFHAEYVDSKHDRIDACFLLGGGRASAALAESKTAFERFRRGVQNDEQWRIYGLTEERVAAVEDTMAAYG